MLPAYLSGGAKCASVNAAGARARIGFEFQFGHEIVALINVCFGIANSNGTIQVTTIINCKH